MCLFGLVAANVKELTKAQQQRYNAVYCGICRQIREHAGQTARLGLQYDMAFLALLLMSLYEPEEIQGDRACILHPIKPRSWVDNEYIRYCADMNVALAYYKAMDDSVDDDSVAAKAIASVFAGSLPRIRQQYPRQCRAMEESIHHLRELEKACCENPDEPAHCFGQLMAQLLIYREDLWQDTLYEMGMQLGRFIYLADAALDYRRDKRKGKYNPFTAQQPKQWEQYLVLAMGRCTDYYERLPLVQDNPLLDNILDSGVWAQYRRRQRCKTEEENDRRSL